MKEVVSETSEWPGLIQGKRVRRDLEARSEIAPLLSLLGAVGRLWKVPRRCRIREQEEKGADTTKPRGLVRFS
ncbi:hypothetical protein GN956_G11264 [Arapaima gigas]